MRALFCSLWILILAAACTQEAGSLSKDVGGACESDDECNPESVCEEGAAFPDGMCTIECESQDDCILSTVCTDMGLCLMVCNTDAECRDGYDCADVARIDAPDSRVCMRDLSP